MSKGDVAEKIEEIRAIRRTLPDGRVIIQPLPSPTSTPHPEDDRPAMRGELREMQAMYGDVREELVYGLQKSRIKFSKALIENILTLSQQLLGIDNMVKLMFKPTRPPATLIGGVIVIVAMIAMFAANPEYGKELGVWLSKPNNQYTLIVVLLICVIIVYFLLRKQKRGAEM